MQLRRAGRRKEGDPVSGKVTRKIKGGLLVDIGVPVFLPASQVDIRRPQSIDEFVGQEQIVGEGRLLRRSVYLGDPLPSSRL